jgi:predicted glycosyltransferase
MNFLIDINHPGQVHLFRHLYALLIQRGHKVVVTVKDIPAAIDLLNSYGISFLHLGSKSDNLAGKGLNQLRYDIKMLRILRHEKIDVAMGSSMSVDHACMFTGTRSIHFSDDDPAVVPLVVKYAHPFADLIVCPDVLTFPGHQRKVIGYPAFHELAYLHPEHFTPDPSVLVENGIEKEEPFFLLRFNAFRAHHDRNNRGLSPEQRRKLVNTLKPHGRIFITSEDDPDEEYREYRLSIRPEKIHSLLSYATLFMGDSQTMTSEAAVLGTPSLKCNSFAGRLSVPNQLEERYGLCNSFLPHRFDEMLSMAVELLHRPSLKEEWQTRRSRMLATKVNPVGFFLWLTENIKAPDFVIEKARSYFNAGKALSL